MQSVIKEIPISDIVVVENIRTSITGESLIELMESIKQHGLQSPVGVAPISNGKYELVWGHRRLAAVSKLGWEIVTAKISNAKTKKEKLVHNIVENIQRKDITPDELGRLCCTLEKEEQMTLGEIAVSLSFPRERVRNAMNIYNQVPDSIKKKVRYMPHGRGRRNGHIPASVTSALINLRKANHISKEDFEGLLNDARVHEMSNSEMEVVVALIRHGMSRAQAIKERNKYKQYRVSIVASVDEVKEIALSTKLKPSVYFQRVVYGEAPAIKKPRFMGRKQLVKFK